MKSVVTSIRLERDENVSDIRRQARVAAGTAGAGLRDQIRFATATSEIARNALEYAGGGSVELDFDQIAGRKLLIARIKDSGPGIGNVAELLAEKIGAAQSGLGLGLKGAQRLVDHFELDTNKDGTLITLGLAIASPLTPTELAATAAKALVIDADTSPVEELAHQNRALRDALGEQQILVRELHHRTKNNLAVIQSLASLQARLMQNEEAREALTVLTNRIQAYANAHNYLHFFEGVTRVDLVPHLESLVKQVTSSFCNDEISLEISVPQLFVSFETASELALMLNELLSLARRRVATRCAHVAVNAMVDEEGLHVEFRSPEGGFGRPEEADAVNRSLGWRIIRGCARKLDATLAVVGEAGEVVTLLFPEEARRRSRLDE